MQNDAFPEMMKEVFRSFTFPLVKQGLLMFGSLT